MLIASRARSESSLVVQSLLCGPENANVLCISVIEIGSSQFTLASIFNLVDLVSRRKVYLGSADPLVAVDAMFGALSSLRISS